MSPAPNRFHQEVSGNLYGLIWSYLRKNPCQAFQELENTGLYIRTKQLSLFIVLIRMENIRQFNKSHT